MDVITTLAHADFGSADCCGCLDGIVDGDQANIVCNECGAIVRTVPVADLQATLNEMELTLAFTTALCPHCQAVNLFPGFTRMEAYVCQSCGRGVSEISSHAPGDER